MNDKTLSGAVFKLVVREYVSAAARVCGAPTVTAQMGFDASESSIRHGHLEDANSKGPVMSDDGVETW